MTASTVANLRRRRSDRPAQLSSEEAVKEIKMLAGTSLSLANRLRSGEFVIGQPADMEIVGTAHEAIREIGQVLENLVKVILVPERLLLIKRLTGVEPALVAAADAAVVSVQEAMRKIDENIAEVQRAALRTGPGAGLVITAGRGRTAGASEGFHHIGIGYVESGLLGESRDDTAAFPGSPRRAKAAHTPKASKEDGVTQERLTSLVSRGDLISSVEFVQRMGWTRQALSKALRSNRVFYVELRGERLYPAFFTESNLYDRARLEQVSKALGTLPGGAKLQFFMSRRGSLGGASVLDALAKGQYKAVLAAAEAFAQTA